MPRTQPQISREKLFDQLGYKPHSDEQWAVHNSTARFRIPCCGRRWGKSMAIGHEMTLSMFVPDSINWIVGPNYGLGEKEFRIVYNDFKKLGLLKHCQKSYNVKQGNMRIFFPDLNSLLEVKTAEQPDGLVGEGLDHVIMSEAAKHKMSTWQMYVQPALSDKRGSADFPSTPDGFNWFEGLYQLGQHPDFPEYESWRLPTWTNAAMFPGGFDPECINIVDGVHYTNMHECTCDDELVQTFNTVSEMYWLQEYGEEFTAFEGLIYPEFRESIHVADFPFNPAWKNWWALDFGYADPFICLDIMVAPDDRVYIWREYVVSYKSTQEHGIILKNRDNPDQFHVDGIAADPRGADEIATLSWTLGTMSANPVGNTLGYEAVKRLLKNREDGYPGLFVHPSCIETIRSLKNLRAQPGKEGYQLTRGQFDHPADALRYFVNEYFVLGGNYGLADVYSGYSGSEAAGFFRYGAGLTLESRFS
jgi:hypothetical protein